MSERAAGPPRRVADSDLAHLLPEVGSAVLAMFPRATGLPGRCECVVVSTDRSRATLSIPVDPSQASAGTAAVVECQTTRGRSIINAFVVETGARTVTLTLDVERRRHERFRHGGRALVEVVGLGEPQETVTEDLSFGGTRLELGSEVRANQRVFVTLSATGTSPVRAIARVVECVPTSGGRYIARLNFSHMSLIDEERLTKLLGAGRPKA